LLPEIIITLSKLFNQDLHLAIVTIREHCSIITLKETIIHCLFMGQSTIVNILIEVVNILAVITVKAINIIG
jgi:hypothetical protein